MSMINFEIEAIYACLYMDQFEKLYRNTGFRPLHFSSTFPKTVFKICEQLYKEKSEINVTTVKTSINILREKKQLSDSMAITFAKKLENLEKSTFDNVNFSINRLKEKRRELDTALALKKATEILANGGSPDEALSTIVRASRGMSGEEYSLDLFNTVDSFEQRDQERALRQKNLITLNFDEHLPFLKKFFPYGLEEETLTAVSAVTNVGKSTVVKNLCYEAIMPHNKLNVLYLSVEDRKIETQDKMDAICLDIPYSIVKERHRDQKSADQVFKSAEKFYKECENGWGQVYVAKTNVGRFTANDIATILDDLENKGVKITVLVVDSPDLMKPINPRRESWENKAEVYVDLKFLQDERGHLTVTTLPLKGSAGGKENVYAEDVAGAYAISRLLDNLVVLGRKEEDFATGVRRITAPKLRGAEVSNHMIQVMINSKLRVEPFNLPAPIPDPDFLKRDVDDSGVKIKTVYKLRSYENSDNNTN